ncbi:MAG: radical SAM family heme chaperone HemW [Candidatus Cloacimonetes bacterium]|nr:radical SAM family heme chaperone HemW [Candidatus Cloacimonadota bacterium]
MIYIHVPFCIRKCGYCSFFSVPLDRELQDRYVSCLVKEIRQIGKTLYPETLYFGGGTPSLLEIPEFEKILSYFDLSHCKELTLEVNPATISSDYAEKLRILGFNRVSIGAQSTDAGELRWLGRIHTHEDTVNCVSMLREAGFDNISLDLIYALPGQETTSVLQSAKALCQLQPQHFSLYCLSLEDSVPLAGWQSKLPDGDTAAEMYENLCDWLTVASFSQYELSNFSLPGFESRHNSAYWNQVPYMGFGPSAAGFTGERRYKNPVSIVDWIEMVDSGSREWEHETLNNREQEYIMLRLRTTIGISFAEFSRRFGVDFQQKYSDVTAFLEKHSMLEEDVTHARLTRKGRFVADEVIQHFFIDDER